MSKFEIVVAQATGTFGEYMERKHGAVARAATAAIDTTRDNLVKDGRDSIASAGFPIGMQKALRGVRYPRGSTPSIDAAAFIWHRSTYAGLFEHGGTVQGKPLLWLPLSTTMPKLGKQKVSPSLMAAKGIDLVSIRSKKGTPLLGAPVAVRTSKQKAAYGSGKVTWSMLKNGRNGKGPFRTIPLFHGVRQVTITKKFDITGAADKARRALPSLFFENYKDQ